MTRAEHHVELYAGWSLWRWVLVRGAGFSARRILTLAAPELVKVVDSAQRTNDEAVRLREQVAGQLRALLRGDGAVDRRVIDKALKALQRGQAPADAADLAPHVPGLAALVELEHARARQQELLEATFVREREHTAEAIRQVASDPRFREAVMWQNRGALVRGVDWLLTHRDVTNKRARQNQHLVANYLQRYCVKNDNIGFFGPVGWGRFSSSPSAVAARPGPQLLDKRTVYYEHWTIDAIAQLIAQDPEVAPFMRPRRMPTVRIEGTTVHYPPALTREVPLPFARALQEIDGNATAREIAKKLLAEPKLELADETEVFDVLQTLAEKRFITWTLEVPTVTEWPERHLRRLVEDIDGDARARAMQLLDRLDEKRAAIQAAAGDPVALERALGALEQTFEELTAKSSTRKSGEMYAARTLVYEDCRRDLDIELGAAFRERVGPALTLLLQAARWYTFRIAELYRAALTQAFDAAAAGASSVDYLTFWQHAKVHFPEDRSPSPHILQANREMQEKWAEIARLDLGARAVDLPSATIGDAIRAAFAAPHPGWPSARYHSPDVMIAAASVDEIARGGGTLVLGELHPSVCTVHHLAQKEHEERASLIRAREVDFPRPIPSPVYAKEHATRADHMWVSRHDIDIESGTTRSWRPRENVLGIGSLVVERRDGQIVVRDRDNRHVFEVIEFFGSYLNAAIANDFDIFPIADHLPRVAIDGVVVVRERWRPDPATLTFAQLESGSEQFVAARRWAKSLGLPRWVFVKVPEEPKPVYVDFDSPLFVDMLAKTVRKASKVSITEMMPTPEQAWLPDAAGDTYTCELRIVCVDPTHWQAPTA